MKDLVSLSGGWLDASGNEGYLPLGVTSLCWGAWRGIFAEAMRQEPNESVFSMARYCLLRGFVIPNDIYIEPLTPPCGANPEQSG